MNTYIFKGFSTPQDIIVVAENRDVAEQKALQIDYEYGAGNIPQVDFVRQITNLTPHPVTIGSNTFPPSGTLARCEETWNRAEEVNGITILGRFKYGETNLPPFDPSIKYIVSLPVALAEPTRTDLLVPVGQVRDETGKIISAKGLASFSNDVKINQILQLILETEPQWRDYPTAAAEYICPFCQESVHDTGKIVTLADIQHNKNHCAYYAAKNL